MTISDHLNLPLLVCHKPALGIIEFQDAENFVVGYIDRGSAGVSKDDLARAQAIVDACNEHDEICARNQRIADEAMEWRQKARTNDGVLHSELAAQYVFRLAEECAKTKALEAELLGDSAP